MADRIKKGDFIELDYSGYTKEGNILFDTTLEDVAKKHKVFNPKAKYEPVIICIGERQLIPGLDSALENSEIGREFRIDVQAEEAFGKKDAKMIKIIPTNVFKRDNVEPQAGLQVNVDGAWGVIISASGGRVLVDFNSPLAGKDVAYELIPRKIITDPKEKLQSYLSIVLNIGKEHVKADVKDGSATVTLPAKLPEQIVKPLSEKLVKIVGLKEVKFASSEPQKAAEEEHEHKH